MVSNADLASRVNMIISAFKMPAARFEVITHDRIQFQIGSRSYRLTDEGITEWVTEICNTKSVNGWGITPHARWVESVIEGKTRDKASVAS